MDMKPILDAIMKLLRKLFSRVTEFGEESGQFDLNGAVNNLKNASDHLGRMSQSNIQNNDILTAYVAKNSQVALDSIVSNLQSFDGKTSLEQLKTKIVADFKEAIVDVANAKISIEAFSDYHNRDEKLIENAIANVHAEAMSRLDPKIWGANKELVSDVLSEVANVTRSELSKPPLTPAQKSGQDPIVEPKPVIEPAPRREVVSEKDLSI